MKYCRTARMNETELHVLIIINLKNLHGNEVSNSGCQRLENRMSEEWLGGSGHQKQNTNI